MKLTFILAIATGAILLARPATAAPPKPVCTAPALHALVKLPPLALACKDDATQFCSSDTPSTLLDDPSCNRAAAAYTKALSRVLTPAWWSAGPETLEACRVHGKPGALSDDEAESLDEGPGEEVQGDDRVRLLVLGNVCGTAGFSNVMLVVRTDRGPVATPLFFAYNQGGQEAPFSLDIVHEGAATYALFTAYSHDMNDAYTGSLTYKVDTATGAATLYPLYKTGAGDDASFGTSEPIGGDSEETGTAQIKEGISPGISSAACPMPAPTATSAARRTAKKATAGTGRNSSPTTTTRRTRIICAASPCSAIASRANSTRRKASPSARVDFPCEGNNDLSLLAYKAALFDRAKQYAADALQECRGRADTHRSQRRSIICGRAEIDEHRRRRHVTGISNAGVAEVARWTRRICAFRIPTAEAARRA